MVLLEVVSRRRTMSALLSLLLSKLVRMHTKITRMVLYRLLDDTVFYVEMSRGGLQGKSKWNSKGMSLSSVTRIEFFFVIVTCFLFECTHIRSSLVFCSRKVPSQGVLSRRTKGPREKGPPVTR
jgi:hypothetical protein